MRQLRMKFTAALLALVVLGACGDDEDPVVPEPQPGDGQKIAAILKSDDPYWTQVAKGIEETAKESGLTAEFFYGKADVDPEGQLAALGGLDLTLYKGVVIAPSAPEAMADGITKVASQLPVAIIDTPIDEAVGYRSFIGTDNRAAGKAFAEWLGGIGESVSGFQMTNYIISLKDSPAIAERVEGFKSVPFESLTPVEIVVEDNEEVAIAQIAETLGKSENPYVLFASNGTVASWTLKALEKLGTYAYLAAFDVNTPLLHALNDEMVNGICAQDSYGMGSEAVKAILDPAAAKTKYLPTKTITLDNVQSDEVAPYLQGIEVPEFLKREIDRSLMTGDFISTSIEGLPYPEGEVMTFSFNGFGSLTIGMNYGAFSGVPEWYELPVFYRMKGDSIIGTGKGFEMRTLVTELTGERMAFNATFSVYGLPMQVKVGADKSKVDYAKQLLGTSWEDKSNGQKKSYGTDGIVTVEGISADGQPTLSTHPAYIRGNHEGANVDFDGDGKFDLCLSLTLDISADGQTMTQKCFFNRGDTDEPVEMVWNFTRVK